MKLPVNCSHFHLLQIIIIDAGKYVIFCYTNSNLSFGNRTNNIVESQKHKIKMALNGKVTFTESIKKLIKLFNIQHDEYMQQNALVVCKTTFVYNSGLPQQFWSKLTTVAVKLVNQQLPKAKKWIDTGVTLELNDDGSVCINERSYIIEGGICTCSLYAGFGLTCAHIFLRHLQMVFPFTKMVMCQMTAGGRLFIQ